MGEVILEHVEKRFGATAAVRDFSLHVRDREFVVLVGPSGCGKSTTLRMIAGLEEVTAGTIRIGDRVVNHLPPRDRDISMVFQNYALYQHMTVYDNLAFGLRNRKVEEPKIREEIARAAKILNIEALLTRRPRQLSGGQQQRVALGRCIVRNPAVFLFDEPLSNLDAQLRSQMRIELKELRQRIPTTSIYVTHDQVEAMTLGDRIVIMNDGRVEQVGTPLEVYRQPRTQFVASFMGSPSMNLVPASFSETGGSGVLETLGARAVLTSHMAATLAGHGKRDLLLGFRPEHVLLSQPPGQDTLKIAGTVRVTEQIGTEQIIDVRVAGVTLRVTRVDADRQISVGETIALVVPAERLHFFDAETGMAISRS